MRAGIFSAAKKFFSNFHKLSSFNPSFAGSKPQEFMMQYKKMQQWWCAQPGNGEQRICLAAAGKKIDKSTPVPKTQVTLATIRASYCAVEAHKSYLPCKHPIGYPFAGRGGPMDAASQGGMAGVARAAAQHRAAAAAKAAKVKATAKPAAPATA